MSEQIKHVSKYKAFSFVSEQIKHVSKYKAFSFVSEQIKYALRKFGDNVRFFSRMFLIILPATTVVGYLHNHFWKLTNMHILN